MYNKEYMCVRKLNSVSRPTHILTLSLSHTRRLSLLLTWTSNCHYRSTQFQYNKPTRTTRPFYQASKKISSISPHKLQQSPAHLSAAQTAEATAPTCDGTYTLYNWYFYPPNPPLFTPSPGSFVNTPTIYHFRCPTLWYYILCST